MATSAQTDEARARLNRLRLFTAVQAGRAFSVATPMTARYAAQLIQWIRIGAQGALVYGWPRRGKTSGTRWALKQIETLPERLPWAEVPMRSVGGRAQVSERQFFEFLVSQLKLVPPTRSNSTEFRNLVSRYLVARAARSPLNSFLLFIDEAQFLQDLHLQWLLNVSNELDAAGLRLFVLLVGQPELIDRKRGLVARRCEQIVGRFMVHEMEFVGVRDEGELGVVLDQFDRTVYPSVHGQPFPSHFIPEGFAEGFRLSHLAGRLFGRFEAPEGARASIRAGGIPMHYVTATVMQLLDQMASQDPVSAALLDRLLVQAVEQSGYADSVLAHRLAELKLSS